MSSDAVPELNTFLPRSEDDPLTAFNEMLEETIASVKEAGGDAMNPFSNCPACMHLFQKRTGSLCGRCQRTRYCTAACRRSDWERHKNSCLPRCRVCDEALIVGVQRCTRCRGVYYCGAECQRVDWSHHKKQCQ